MTIDAGERYSDATTLPLSVNIPNGGTVHVGTLTFSPSFYSSSTYAAQNTHITTLSDYPLAGTSFTISNNDLLGNVRGVGFTLTAGTPISEVKICRVTEARPTICGGNDATIEGIPLRFIARISPPRTTGDVTVRMAVADVGGTNFLSGTEERTLTFTIPPVTGYTAPIVVQTQPDSGSADGDISIIADTPSGFDRYSSDSLGITGANTVPMLDTRILTLCRIANKSDGSCPAPNSLPNPSEGEDVHFLITMNKTFPGTSLPIGLEYTATGGSILPGGVATYATPQNELLAISSGATATNSSIELHDDNTLSNPPVSINVQFSSSTPRPGMRVEPSGGITFIVDDNDTPATVEAPADFTVDESVGTLTFTVTVDGASPTADATVDYTVTGSSDVAFSVVGGT
ncbi:MAG: hypothetical protein OXF45_01525, partial [Candidatus Dadabacteria bacterium]|nr:hypothetical protein [Candidatus Dadabacteria bacterium]